MWREKHSFGRKIGRPGGELTGGGAAQGAHSTRMSGSLGHEVHQEVHEPLHTRTVKRWLSEVEEWREKFLAAAENALRSRPRDEEAQKDEQIKKLKQKVGELVLDMDIVQEAMKGRPFDRETSDE